jgi:hypothetical protein
VKITKPQKDFQQLFQEANEAVSSWPTEVPIADGLQATAVMNELVKIQRYNAVCEDHPGFPKMEDASIIARLTLQRPERYKSGLGKDKWDSWQRTDSITVQTFLDNVCKEDISGTFADAEDAETADHKFNINHFEKHKKGRNGDGKPWERKKKICFHFKKKDGCWKGKDCKFLHSDEQSENSGDKRKPLRFHSKKGDDQGAMKRSKFTGKIQPGKMYTVNAVADDQGNISFTDASEQQAESESAETLPIKPAAGKKAAKKGNDKKGGAAKQKDMPKKVWFGLMTSTLSFMMSLTILMGRFARADAKGAEEYTVPMQANPVFNPETRSAIWYKDPLTTTEGEQECELPWISVVSNMLESVTTGLKMVSQTVCMPGSRITGHQDKPSIYLGCSVDEKPKEASKMKGRPNYRGKD